MAGAAAAQQQLLLTLHAPGPAQQQARQAQPLQTKLMGVDFQCSGL
jgi:hypothetical protein